jgi:tetratricopeptide (TPR) repeat protein
LIMAIAERAEKLPVPEGHDGRAWLSAVGEAWNSGAMLAYSQGDNARGIPLAQRAVELAQRAGDQGLLALALGFQASSTVFLGRFGEALPLLEAAVAAAEQAGDRSLAGMPMVLRGQILSLKDPPSSAVQALMVEGAALMAESGDRWLTAMAQLGMAMNAVARGSLDEARTRFASIRPLFQELGDRHRLNMTRSEIAHIDRHEGNLDAAEAAYRETIKMWKQLGHRAAIAHQLESFAAIAQRLQDPMRAARLYGAAEALREVIDIPMTQAEKVEYDADVADLGRSLDEQTLASAWEQGRRLSMDQAVTYAVSNSLPAR